MKPEKRRPYRRRRLVVKALYQWKVTLAIVSLFLLFAVVTLLVVFYALWSTLHTLELWTETVFVEVFRVVLWTVVLEFAVLLPIFVVAGLMLTHRVVGPLERVTGALDQMSRGDFNVHVKVRRDDVLRDLSFAVNRVGAYVRRRQIH